MAFPKTTKYNDKNTTVETRLENGSYITFITNLDESIEVYRSGPVPTETQAEGNHKQALVWVEEGIMGYFETEIADD